jgi:hypothetical protein
MRKRNQLFPLRFETPEKQGTIGEHYGKYPKPLSPIGAKYLGKYPPLSQPQEAKDCSCYICNLDSRREGPRLTPMKS